MFVGKVKTRTETDGETLMCCQRRGCREYCTKLLQCARCKEIQYCSKECQVQDWNGCHKNFCVPIKNKVFVDPNENVTCGLCFGRMHFEPAADTACKHHFHLSCLKRINKVRANESIQAKTENSEGMFCPFCEELTDNVYAEALSAVVGRQLKDAELAYRKHLQKEGRENDTVALFGLSSVLLIAGSKHNLSETELLMKQIAKIDPYDAKAVIQLAYYKNTAGSFEQAITQYKKALKLEPQCSESVYTGLSRAQFCKGSIISALETTKKASEVYPNSETVTRYHYLMLKVNGKHKEARKLLSKMCASPCRMFDSDVWSMALTLYKLEPPKHFVRLFQLVTALPPKMDLLGIIALLTNLGLFFAQDPLQHDNARKILDLAVGYNPKDDRASKALFSILAKKARRNQGKDVELLYDTVEAGKILLSSTRADSKSKIELAILLQQQVDFDTSLKEEDKKENIDEAEELFKDVLKIEENNQVALQYAGLFYQNQNRPAEAEVLFTKLLKINPKHPSASKYLKIVKLDQGKAVEPERALTNKLTISE